MICSAGLLTMALAATPPAFGQTPAPAAAKGQASFRIAFMADIFGDVERADAKAAVITWAETFLDEAGIPVDRDPLIAESLDELAEALREKRIDAVSLGITHFLALPKGLLQEDVIFSNEQSRGSFESYVILVHRDSGISDAGGLRGMSLVVWNHARADLALPWLDTYLAEHELPFSQDLFGSRTRENKPAKVILPVFFKQQTACVVSRSAFEDMAELNPQVGEQLRVLAESPKIVPALFCFRSDYENPLRSRLEDAIVTIHETPAGEQILTAFMCERILRRSGSCLDSARKIFDEWTGFRPRAKSSAARLEPAGKNLNR